MRLPTAALCAWVLSGRALGIKRPSDVDRKFGQGTDSESVPSRRVDARKADLGVDRQIVEIESNYEKVFNDCAKSVPNFLQDLVGLKRTIPDAVLLKMKNTFQHVTGPAYMLTNSMHLTCMVDNFLVQLSKVKPEPMEVVLFSLDRTSHDFCRSRENEDNIILHCIHVYHWIEDYNSSTVETKSNGMPFDSCNYIKVTWAKPMLIYHAARMSRYGVLMIDSDIIVHKDMFEWIRENRLPATELITGDDGGPWHPNSGTTYADKHSLNILEEWTDNAGVEEIVQSPRGEQEALRAVLDKDGNFHRLQEFPKRPEMKGSVGQCSTRGDLATHYNCIKQKISEMNKVGFWGPRDPDCHA